MRDRATTIEDITMLQSKESQVKAQIRAELSNLRDVTNVIGYNLKQVTEQKAIDYLMEQLDHTTERHNY